MQSRLKKLIGMILIAASLNACSGDSQESSQLAFTNQTSKPTSITSREVTTGQGEAKKGVPTTMGSGLAPVTTTKAYANADTNIYKGRLGRLKPNEQLVEPVAPQPKTKSGTMPLTGLAGKAPTHPAAVVKIDNSSSALPQTGLNQADIVVEEEVEGGITRLAAVFHSQSAIVGPVRSGRTTDIGVLASYGSPLFIYSGANEVTDALLIGQSAVQNRSASRSSGFWRESSRRAPSNLYTDMAPHWASADPAAPPAQFEYLAPNEEIKGTASPSFTVSFGSRKAGWEWSGRDWKRSQDGVAHKAVDGQIRSANIVVVEVPQVDTGMVDGSGSMVPEFVFVGSGKATVFTGGKRIEGRWTRPRLADAATLTSADNEIIKLTPGTTWVEMVKQGSNAIS